MLAHPHHPSGDLTDWVEDVAFVAVLLVGATLVATVLALIVLL
jgi:hypothetical protein